MSYPFDCITEFMFFESVVEPADVILIPGGSQPQLMERAASLYHQNYAPYILPSGGPTQNVNTTEWEYLRNIGIELGVPENSILREDKASNTFENSRLSYQVLQQMRIHPSPITDKTGITKDNWFLDEKRIYHVMNELTKVGQYFAHHIPHWVDPSSHNIDN